MGDVLVRTRSLKPTLSITILEKDTLALDISEIAQCPTELACKAANVDILTSSYDSYPRDFRWLLRLGYGSDSNQCPCHQD